MTTPRAIEHVPLAQLVAFEKNPRTHSDFQIAQIASSIRAFGFTNPLLIDEDSNIIAGHGRLAAARLIGLEHVECIRIAGLTPAQKKALVIADNKLALNAAWDHDQLGALIDELKSDDFDVTVLGFSDAELEAMQDVVTGNSAAQESGNNADEETVRCPACGHEWTP